MNSKLLKGFVINSTKVEHYYIPPPKKNTNSVMSLRKQSTHFNVLKWILQISMFSTSYSASTTFIHEVWYVYQLFLFFESMIHIRAFIPLKLCYMSCNFNGFLSEDEFFKYSFDFSATSSSPFSAEDLYHYLVFFPSFILRQQGSHHLVSFSFAQFTDYYQQ